MRSTKIGWLVVGLVLLLSFALPVASYYSWRLGYTTAKELWSRRVIVERQNLPTGNL